MKKCSLCQKDLVFKNKVHLNQHTLSDGSEICSACKNKVTKINPFLNIKKHKLLDIKEVLNSPENHQPSPKQRVKAIFFSFLFLGVIFFSIKSCFFGGDNPQLEDKPQLYLNAEVSFDGVQFIIKNKDIFDYNNARFEVNGKYKLRGNNLKAGEVYTVGMMQFSDREGNRLNVLQKPQQFLINCVVDNNEMWYLAGWD